MRPPRRCVATVLGCAALAVLGSLAAGAVTGSAARLDDIAPTTTTTTTTTATATTNAKPAPKPSVPRLTITPAVTPAAATVGSTLTYTAAVRNAGSVTTGWSVADTLPDGVALIAVDADQGGTCTVALPRVTCGWDAVTRGVTATATIVVQVIAPGTLENGVELVPSIPSGTTVTANPSPPPVEAGEGVAVRFAPSATP